MSKADEHEGPQDAAVDEGAEYESEDSGRGGFLDGLIPDLVRKAITQGVEALADEKVRENLVGDVLRKAIHKGGAMVDITEDSVRRFISDLPIPNDVGEKIVGRFDDYRGEVFRILKDEIHEAIERIDVGREVQKVLTSLSLEVNTEIRFIPNEKGVKPEVKSRARVKRTRRSTKKRATPAAPSGASESEPATAAQTEPKPKSSSTRRRTQSKAKKPTTTPST